MKGYTKRERYPVWYVREEGLVKTIYCFQSLEWKCGKVWKKRSDRTLIRLVWSRFQRLHTFKIHTIVHIVSKTVLSPAAPDNGVSRPQIDIGSLPDGLHMPDMGSTKLQPTKYIHRQYVCM